MKISVVLTTYNHEKYISQCLDSILCQKGNFEMEVIVGDDCSTDKTREIIYKYQIEYPTLINLLPPEKNLGITKNLKRCLNSCSGDYIAICEGDDYWTDVHKLQKQADYLELHQDFSMCFSAVMIYYEDQKKFAPFDDQLLHSSEVITTEDLIENNYIGNFSCCMYRTNTVRNLPNEIYDIFTVDWMFNMACGQFGKIGFIRDWMSVYRKHPQGSWSGKPEIDRLYELKHHIDVYNIFFNYRYDSNFIRFRRVVEDQIARVESAANIRPLEQQWDLVIIDDVFPHPLSAFRFQEFNTYLKEFGKAKILCTGASLSLLGSDTLEEICSNLKRNHPEYAMQIENFKSEKIIDAKIIYLVFLANAFTHIEYIEKIKTPFVFTLYPGGMFGLNSDRSDIMLKRVTSSPCFRKVIVTQKVTYDYLIEKNFCTPEQIEFIYGGVIPISVVESEFLDKRYFFIDKSTLDICFVANKYTKKGVDKGYDVFIDIAKILCGKYNNVHFHVVGGFDENDIEIKDLENKITFYGFKQTSWFDEFYRDKDIILSPNIPFNLYEGSFDGFPTGSCVDAGLRKTAIFCTDELHMNQQFIDGEEIVIIPHDAVQAAKIIEGYYNNPERLKQIAENGYRKMRLVFSYEAQISTRITILRDQIELSETSKKNIVKELNGEGNYRYSEWFTNLLFMLLLRIKRTCPLFLKRIIKTVMQRIRSNKKILSIMKFVCPKFIMKVFMMIRVAS